MSTIKIVDSPSSANIVKIGDNTLAFMNRQDKLTVQGKCVVTDEAKKILEKCIKPGLHNNITNIAVGYVQSGKTLSFTTLTALAADNGYRIIIYLTGTKTNLQEQTAKRLESDLDIENSFGTYRLFGNIANSMSAKTNIRNFLKGTNEVLLFPILKHYKHIERLADVFAELQPELDKIGVLIIDDEADQSSFNTYAKKNAKNGHDWEDGEFSKTYASILKLKKNLPSHSYVQYTATPQAAFLIDNNDILSPTYHTVLTPGVGYTGGKVFFKEKERGIIQTIPEDECYHYKKNPLATMPKSLEKALKEFLISIAIAVFIQKRVKFLSMMIHIDGKRDSNEKFAKWTIAKIDSWSNIFQSPEGDPGKDLEISNFRNAYDEITIHTENAPSFDEVMSVMNSVLIYTQVRLVQGNEDNNIRWHEFKGHILVGADMLNRGFTIENLSMTYMPRTSAGKATADTIEQRCRFFGYKAKYIDICRVYLPAKGINDYVDYVDHEENLRGCLKQCSSLKEFTKHKNAMLIADTLNPTRTNILSKDLVRTKLSGWSSLRSLDYIDENKIQCKSFLDNWSANDFEKIAEYDNVIRNHRFVKCSIEKFIGFFKQIRYADVPNITRKIVTIQYLEYLKETLGIDHVYIIEMAYAAKNELRERGLEKDESKPKNLMAGRAANGSYPGDEQIKFTDAVCIQFHHIRIKQSLSIYNNKDLYNLSIFYPEQLATSFVGTGNDDDEEE